MHDNDIARRRTTEPLSVGLGWFSIALGVAEVLAPEQLARLIGVRPTERTRSLLRAYGAREIASGIGILAQPAGAQWLWARVGGDALDLATLGTAAGDEGADRNRLALAAAAVAGVAVLDYVAARRLSTDSAQPAWDGLGLNPGDEQALTIRAPIEQVEEAWVEWCASGYARLKNNYAVRFEPAPAARGTEVRISGGGSKGTIREELRRFKQLVETGEIPLSDGPGLWRPAQPARSPEEIKRLVEVL